MLIINGVEVLKDVYMLTPTIKRKVSVYTDDHTVTKAQTGHTLVMSAGANNKKFVLPTVTAADVGLEFTFANIGTGSLEIEGPGGTVKVTDNVQITSDDDVFATVTLRLVSALQWSVVGAHGTWTSGA